MAKIDKLIVEQRDDGRWQVKKPHSGRSSAVENTQRAAIARAKELAPEGHILVRGPDGKSWRIDERLATRKKPAAKPYRVRARVRGHGLELLEAIPFREGEEVVVNISKPVEAATDNDALRRAAGAWKDLVDAQSLITNIYADRLIATRLLPRV